MLWAFLTIVVRASVTGTNTTSRIIAVMIATARRRLPARNASSLIRNGHVATLTMVAHRIDMRNGLKTQKVDAMNNAMKSTDRVMCVMSTEAGRCSLIPYP